MGLARNPGGATPSYKSGRPVFPDNNCAEPRWGYHALPPATYSPCRMQKTFNLSTVFFIRKTYKFCKITGCSDAVQRIDGTKSSPCRWRKNIPDCILRLRLSAIPQLVAISGEQSIGMLHKESRHLLTDRVDMRVCVHWKARIARVLPRPHQRQGSNRVRSCFPGQKKRASYHQRAPSHKEALLL